MPQRVLALLALAAIAGCSADEVHSPLDFFPGSQQSSWTACDKFGPIGDKVEVCASYLRDPATNAITGYSVSFFIPSSMHVRIAAFDSHGTLVNLLFDSDEPATIGQFRTPPIFWYFTDSHGARVPAGDYRLYLSAGESFLSSSDVEVP